MTEFMPFIVASNADKADPVTRKLIRSHARRGKKKQGRLDRDGHGASPGPVARRNQKPRARLEEIAGMYTPVVPGRIGSDFSFVESADEMGPAILLNLTKVTPMAVKVIFPLVAAIGFHKDNERIYPIAQDATALHIRAFAVEGFIDLFLRHQETISQTAMLHFHKGMRLLRQRLLGDDDEAKISDSTIGVVLKLASTAHVNGDHQTAKKHMGGLRRMVDLRGGLLVLGDNELLVEILRCDLSIATLNGSKHAFFRHPSEPLIEYPETLLPAGDCKRPCLDNLEFIPSLDDDLATAWRVMRRFCLLVDLGEQTQRCLRLELFHRTMSAVMYRLLQMQFVFGSVDEAVRHGLLAFTYHIFLQWQDVKLPYRHFSSAYQSCIMRLEFVDDVSPQLVLWMLMIGAVSVFDFSGEAWLRESLRKYADRCHVKSWKEMQNILKSVMWIPLLDEHPGKHVYELLYLDEVERLDRATR